jgi:hypothetical protein
VAPISFLQLAARDIRRIEIPIIQRDYAQGRRDEETTRIRIAFLSVLRAAVETKAIHLDFVYGEVNGQTLIPLDGQQRLTALFLLHWYVAARAHVTADEASRMPVLSYETRHSAQIFCEKLVNECPFPLGEATKLSDWIRDRSWFVRVWRHDPTIESMLVVLDDIHLLFAEVDPTAAWSRLADAERPAITFHFEAIANLGLTDDLYIKMNSRGKPLTRFENFKAEFEALIRRRSNERYEHLCAKIDNQWSDLLWRVRGSDNSIDEQFLRYLRFISKTLAELQKLPTGGSDMERAETVFGENNKRGAENLAFLFHAFDTWEGVDPDTWFEGVFSKSDHEVGKVVVFDNVALFRACCGDNRTFPIWKSLLMFAALIHRESDTAAFTDRLRTLRNLAFNSSAELREYELPSLLRDTRAVIANGDVTSPGSFNTNQTAEEIRKVAFLVEHTALSEPLKRLEDHPLLRGCLAAFDLDADVFERRARLFAAIFSRQGGLPQRDAFPALLACGDYSQRNQNEKFQFGNESREVWRDLLTRQGHRDFNDTKSALTTLLDSVLDDDSVGIDERLRQVTDDYLTEREGASAFDWRYYLVKYGEMRQSESGLYASPDDMLGFSLCALRKTQLNGKYRDPYLLAIAVCSGVDLVNDLGDLWFRGRAYIERWLEVINSGTALRCTKEGFVVRPPSDDRYRAAFDELGEKQGIEGDLLLIPQVTVDKCLCDTEDRVQIGARLLRDIVAMVPS